MGNAFGGLLREWRELRAMSQQRLAELSEVSARHISFVETGRSSPSREMVLVLANALDLPLRERNTLLGAAGFAAVYTESRLDAEAMTPVRRALDHLLAQQEPYPAVVVDRAWNVVRMNAGARRAIAALVEPSALPALTNVARALFDPALLRPAIVNWEEVAGEVLGRLRREALLDHDGGGVRPVLDAILALPDVAERLRRPRLLEEAPRVLLPVHFRRGAVDARFFTTITTLGTPLDVAAQEMRVESYFPADDAAERWVRALARDAARASL